MGVVVDGADVALVAGALLMRVLVGLSPYSGSNDPPKYGDYEAQRHWMELALGLPPREWYDDAPDVLARLGVGGSGGDEESASSSGRHWPLDYPPLSGYQSWLTGILVRAVEPAAVALGAQSHGHDSPASKAAMRATVLLCDAAVFFPAAFWMAGALAERVRRRRVTPSSSSRPSASSFSTSSSTYAFARVRRAAAAVLLLNPALVLVDHGHFQYNCLSLGLALGAMAALVAPPIPRGEEEEETEETQEKRGRAARASSEQQQQQQQRRRPAAAAPPPPPPPPAPPLLPRGHLVAAVLFTLSLCHKQMGLYYAPAFFAHMLGACLGQQPTWPRRAAAVAALGATVGATMAAALLPVVWGHREGLLGGVRAVLARVFPLGRGLYEDYVANFWCATSVGPVKWRELLGGPSAAVRVALAATVAAALPSMAQQVAAPSAHGFLLGCANSAAAFFLFSFQVHEKSALLPLMPATLLPFALLRPLAGPPSSSRWMAQSSLSSSSSSSRATLAALAVWGPAVACFGMFPLLERDGVAAAYAACIVAYVAVVGGLVDDALLAVAVLDGAQAGKDDEGAATAATASAPGAALPLFPTSRRAGAGVVAAAVAGALALHAARLLYEPPARLPWLHDRLFVTYAFVFIALGAVYLNWVQWWCWAPSAGGATGRGRVGVGKGAAEEQEERQEEVDARAGGGDAVVAAVTSARSPQRTQQRPRRRVRPGADEQAA